MTENIADKRKRGRPAKADRNLPKLAQSKAIQKQNPISYLNPIE